MIFDSEETLETGRRIRCIKKKQMHRLQDMEMKPTIELFSMTVIKFW